MKQQNLDTLIDRLYAAEERSEHAVVYGDGGYNGAIRHFPCGSPADLAGHAATLQGDSACDASVHTLTDYLGVDLDTAFALRDGIYPTRRDAIAALEAIA